LISKIENKTVAKKKTVQKEPDDSKKILKMIKKILVEKKCEDTVFLDLEKINTYLSIFVITTVQNNLQASAVGKELERSLKEFKLIKPNRNKNIEGNDDGWLLMDFGDIIIHIMTPEIRNFYSLDKLWGDAKAIKI
jgi:ribosome-associated protein